MNSSRRTGLLALIGACTLMLGGCQAGADAPPASDIAADEAAVRGVLDAIARDFNAGDMEQMVAHYQDDVLVSAPGAPDILGKQAWLDSIAATLPPDAGLTLRFDTAELAISGDLAYERGTYAIGMATQPDAQPMIVGRHIHIFRRQADGSWKGWRLMENSSDPATSPVPPPA
jgi:ketosteroid isomerase-like protein